MATDVTIGIGDIENKKIIPTFYERRILFIPIDEIPVFGKNLSEHGSAGIDTASGGSWESNGNFHLCIFRDMGILNVSMFRKYILDTPESLLFMYMFPVFSAQCLLLNIR